MKKYFLLLVLVLTFTLISCTEDKQKILTKSIRIINITPSNANIGDTIYIYGNGFGNSKTNGKISINGNKASLITSWSDSLIVVKIPYDTKSGKILVYVEDKKSNEINYIIGAEKTSKIVIMPSIFLYLP